MHCQYYFESIKQWDKWMRRCLPLLNLSAASALDSLAAQSHTDANFNQQSQTCLLRLNLWLPMTLGKLILFVRSVLWDLNIPQEAATLLYEDNDVCNAMGNAQKPTPRTCHIDIKYVSLCEWVERDLILLDQIDTSINISNHLTKPLQTLLFHRHTNFLLGHVPPSYSPVYSTISG